VYSFFEGAGSGDKKRLGWDDLTSRYRCWLSEFKSVVLDNFTTTKTYHCIDICETKK